MTLYSHLATYCSDFFIWYHYHYKYLCLENKITVYKTMSRLISRILEEYELRTVEIVWNES